MAFKPIPTRKFKKFLKRIGLIYIRTESSHEIWDKADGSLLRPVVFRSKEKEIPPLPIQTNLKTLGIPYNEFLKIIQKI